ncbi:MAG: HmuY family protein [Deltaproteobacteria bacterium]|nr:HmuY family protein [Deltaproteobacteria bacterium]
MHHPIHLCVLVTALAAGCAADLSDELEDVAPADGGAQIEHTVDGDLIDTKIDATDEARWVYLDLESRGQLEIDDPQASDAWDLAFRRYDIALDGGVSGPGGMAAVVLEGQQVDDVEAVADGPWITDAADGDDHGDAPDYALGDWYDYDFATHVLTPRVQAYVVRSVEGNAFALEVVDYYDDAGSSGWLQLRWKPLP